MGNVKGLPIDKQTWEDQYKTGRWSYLGNIPEMSRYPFIAAHIERDAERPRVLDVGGGEGVLYSHFDDRRLDRYVCIDLAESAIETAPVPRDKATFIACDIEEYNYGDEDIFTAVVFNEVLYYTKDPMQVLRAAATRIQPSGLIIISMYHDPQPASRMRKTVDALWHEIDTCPWPTLDFVALTNIIRNRTWMVRVLRAGDKP